MQQEFLETRRDVPLKVYAVWFSMLDGDKRQAFQPELLTDSRVTHLWDEQKVVGRWFAENFEVEDFGGPITWDAFFLFGSDAEWANKPSPLLSSGFTIRSKKDDLRQAWDALFQQFGNSLTGTDYHIYS